MRMPGVEAARGGIIGFVAITAQVGAGNVRLVREYVAYLRVEKGLRPNSVVAYQRDLEQFAEHIEAVDGLLVSAEQEAVRGSPGICGSMGWSRGRLRGS